MAGTAKQFRILIVAAEPEQAKAILTRLTAARLHVRALFTQYPDKLRALTSEHPCDLILVRIGGTIAASEVAAVRRETGARTPLLILNLDLDLDLDQSDPGELVELMSAGADGLIRDLDDGRLVFLIRRWIAQADSTARLQAPPAYPTALAADLRGSIEPGSMPIAQDQSIDAETGLPDRSALLSELAHRLSEDPSPQNRQVTLLYARIRDFDSMLLRLASPLATPERSRQRTSSIKPSRTVYWSRHEAGGTSASGQLPNHGWVGVWRTVRYPIQRSPHTGPRRRP